MGEKKIKDKIDEIKSLIFIVRDNGGNPTEILCDNEIYEEIRNYANDEWGVDDISIYEIEGCILQPNGMMDNVIVR